jgi:hypothetical protein
MARNDRKREAERMVAVGKPRFAKEVFGTMARLGGSTRADVVDDRVRGHMSPLSGDKHRKARR